MLCCTQRDLLEFLRTEHLLCLPNSLLVCLAAWMRKRSCKNIHVAPDLFELTKSKAGNCAVSCQWNCSKCFTRHPWQACSLLRHFDTSLGSIQPRCNYCAKTTRLYITLILYLSIRKSNSHQNYLSKSKSTF